MTMLALAPSKVPFPPRQAPKERATARPVIAANRRCLEVLFIVYVRIRKMATTKREEKVSLCTKATNNFSVWDEVKFRDHDTRRQKRTDGVSGFFGKVTLKYARETVFVSRYTAIRETRYGTIHERNGSAST